MRKTPKNPLSRRVFIKTGIGGMAFAVFPHVFLDNSRLTGTEDFLGRLLRGKYAGQRGGIEVVIRDETLFAGIRKPIKERRELEPRIAVLKKACAGKTAGPLTHIFRFDTPVEGYDSEIGFPVSAEVSTGDIKTHKLRKMHFYSLLQNKAIEKLSESSGKLYQYMSKTGLSPELELVEIYEDYNPDRKAVQKIQVMAAFLAWPEVYREQLERVLGKGAADEVWRDGEKITPHTLVDERCAWVGETIDRLKARTTVGQQFDILSRVALIRPSEDVMKYKAMYDKNKDINTVFRAQEEQLKETPTGGYVDPPHFDGKILHVSKVPYNGKAYMEAKTHREKRKAYCFCNLVREAEDPKIDPIFCYRAAGWARQFWEPILGVEFKKCLITHSILKGDNFCAWDYYLE